MLMLLGVFNRLIPNLKALLLRGREDQFLVGQRNRRVLFACSIRNPFERPAISDDSPRDPNCHSRVSNAHATLFFGHLIPWYALESVDGSRDQRGTNKATSVEMVGIKLPPSDYSCEQTAPDYCQMKGRSRSVL